MILNLTFKNNYPIVYLDYIIKAGQSNMNGRVPYYTYYTGDHIYTYDDPHSVVKSYDIDTNTLTAYDPHGDIEHFYQSQSQNISWGDMLAFDFYTNIPAEYRFISVSYGGTACGDAWKKDSGAAYLLLKERILAMKTYAISIGKVARCRLILWDQKESDADSESYSLNYCYDDNGTLKGNFVDCYTGICETAGQGNIPIVFAEQMSTQQDPYYANVITAQNLFANNMANAFLLPLESNNSSVTLQDQWHYDGAGQAFVRDLALNTILNNNLLNGWS